MPTETTQREYTATETQAYERYISAVVEHNIVCARPGATTKEKMDAAFAINAAFRDFCRIAGMEMGNVRSLADLERIEAQEAQIRNLTEAVRSAYSMLFAIKSVNVFEFLPANPDMNREHGVCCTLLDDAQAILSVALNKADGI